MPYITKGNANKLVKHIDIKSLPDNFAENKGNLYKRNIWFFNNIERNKLLLKKELLRNPSSFFEVYSVIPKQPDTYTYIYEGGSPAYHYSIECERLNSDFIAYEVPVAIREKGPESVKKFRLWFSQNRELYEKNIDTFTGAMIAAFGMNESVKPVQYENSGIEIVENLNLNQLEHEINTLLKEAADFFVFNTYSIQRIIRKYEKRTFIAYSKKEIEDNDTEMSDDALKEFLKDYDEKFKNPIKKYLNEYYRVYFNPDLEFDGLLLDVVGFKKCSICCK